MVLSALMLVKLGVVLLGVCNLVITFKGRSSPSPSPSIPRQIHIKNDLNIQLFHLDVDIPAVPMITEESVRYPVHGPLADQDWASLVPEGNHGLILLDPPSSHPDPHASPRPYAIAMFHTLHCLDRIRRAIAYPGSEHGSAEHGVGSEPPETTAQARFHVHHCFNYVRQMVLCAANTRLNPINHVLPTGELATDGIGLEFQCRDWRKVYDVFEANYALNRTMTFA